MAKMKNAAFRKWTPEKRAEILKRYALWQKNAPQRIIEETKISQAQFLRIVNEDFHRLCNLKRNIKRVEAQLNEGVCKNEKRARQQLENWQNQLNKYEK